MELFKFKDLWECYNLWDNTFWIRLLRSWEHDLILDLNHIISSISFNLKEDVLIWNPEKDTYSVRKGVDHYFKSLEDSSVSWDFIWKLKIPHKVMLFLWKFHNGILPSKEFLAKRLGLVHNQLVCSSCNKLDESTSHIFWHCSPAKILWTQTISWWGLSGWFHIEDLSTLWHSCSFFPSGLYRQVWQIVLISCLWTLWLERNNVHFTGKSISGSGLLILLKHRSLEWCVAADLICLDKSGWWESNPMGLITASLVLKDQRATSVDTSLVAFIDGSFKPLSVNKISSGALGGIEGLDKYQNGKKVIEFLGPSSELNCSGY